MEGYKRLIVSGPISLQRAQKVSLEGGKLPKIFLLLGLTGAGKSNFLERLSGDTQLGISGNSLESVTQEVVLYKVINASYDDQPYSNWSCSIYILDTPGLGDTNLSEHRTIRMLQEFMVAHLSGCAIYSIFYLHRITDKRFSGSQKKTLDLIKALVGPPAGTTWTGVVTTMWDTLWLPEQVCSAENRFQQLKDEHFKEAFGPTTDLAFRFANTQESALGILDGIHPSWPYQSTSGPPFTAFMGSYHYRIGPFATHVYQYLMDRVAATEHRIRALDDELQQEDTQNNPEPLSRLERERIDADNVLQALAEDCIEFGPAPDCPDVEPSETPWLSESVTPHLTIRKRVITYLRKKFRSARVVHTK